MSSCEPIENGYCAVFCMCVERCTYNNVFLVLLQVPMSIAWAVRIVKKSSINSTFLLASVQHARGKNEKSKIQMGCFFPNTFSNTGMVDSTFCFEQTILKLIFVHNLNNFMQRADHRLSCLSVMRKWKTKDCASLPLLAPNVRMP